MNRTSLARLALCAILAPGLAIAQQGQPGAHFIENWDLDRDGRVTLAEATEKRADIFYMFDQNEDGTLQSGEYDLFDETRAADIATNGGGARGPMQGVNQAMDRGANDRDGDGMVTRAEFLDTVPDWFAMMDRDSDGAITTADFGPRRGAGN